MSYKSPLPPRHLSAVFALLPLAVLAQTAQPKPDLFLFHPPAPLTSYEVATIKPLSPDAANAQVRLPPGVARSAALNPLTIRRYIMNAYGAVDPAQVVGGPDWLSKDTYQINGKAPDDVEAAFKNMKPDDRVSQNRSMQQSLLADRFHLKAHFETRILPVYELVPAKGGLKITEIPAPPEPKPGDPPPRFRAGGQLPPGSMMTTLRTNSLRTLKAHAVKMPLLARVIAGDAGDRLVVDHTGFTGYFDIDDLTWAPLGDASATSTPDAPSLTVAIGEKFGLKLVPAKDPIEVLVIDSIDRPSEN